MADIAFESVELRRQLILHTWRNVTNADNFDRFEFSGPVEEIGLDISGTFDGATVTVNVSFDDDDGAVATKIGGGNATASERSVFSIVERPLFITITHSGGGASEDVTVKMMVVK